MSKGLPSMSDMRTVPEDFLGPPKPPLGIMPRYLWVEQRARMLCECLGRYAHDAADLKAYLDQMREHTQELDGHLVWLKSQDNRR